MFEIRAFGKLQLGHEKAISSHFPTRQVEELLGFLLLDPYVQHTREKLITVLWPNIDFSGGRHRFSVVLSRLRKMFHQLGVPPEGYIHSTREWVSFSPERPFSFDRDQFVQQCHLGLHAENLVQRESFLSSAIALYHADLMEGIFADWCLLERERLARLRLRALGQLMYCCMQRRAYAEAIEYGHTILKDDALREETHRALMQCYQGQGRLDLAARQYKACVQLLHEELNELPLPETRDSYIQIMEQRALLSLEKITSPADKASLQTALLAFHQAAQHLESLL